MAERIQQPRRADGSGSEMRPMPRPQRMFERQQKSKDAAMKQIEENIKKYNPLIGD